MDGLDDKGLRPIWKQILVLIEIGACLLVRDDDICRTPSSFCEIPFLKHLLPDEVLLLFAVQGQRHVLLSQGLLKSAQRTKLPDLTVDLHLDTVLQFLLGDREEGVFCRLLNNQLQVDELIQDLQLRLQELGRSGRTSPSPRLHGKEGFIDLGLGDHGISDDRDYPLDYVDALLELLSLAWRGDQEQGSN